MWYTRTAEEEGQQQYLARCRRPEWNTRLNSRASSLLFLLLLLLGCVGPMNATWSEQCKAKRRRTIICFCRMNGPQAERGSGGGHSIVLLFRSWPFDVHRSFVLVVVYLLFVSNNIGKILICMQEGGGREVPLSLAGGWVDRWTWTQNSVLANRIAIKGGALLFPFPLLSVAGFWVGSTNAVLWSVAIPLAHRRAVPSRIWVWGNGFD